MSHSDKVHVVQKCLNAFVDKFGKQDAYSNLVIEGLFEVLYGRKPEEIISLSPTERQEGHENIEHFPLQAMPADQDYQFINSKTSR